LFFVFLPLLLGSFVYSQTLAEIAAKERERRESLKGKKAKEYVELLTLKMGALWQEYYGLDATASKEPVQQAISETFIKLEQTQEEEGRAWLELERLLGQAKKDSVPSIWIR
jgi:hypothetical protein